MNQIYMKISQMADQEKLMALFAEAKPYFIQVEGREPLEPLADIRKKIGNPPPDETVSCYTIFFNEQVAGYTWILVKPQQYYYILHFYIADKFKRKGVGKEIVKQLDELFHQQNIKRSELMVSASNYFGLKFWTSVGYDRIIYVEAPEENSLTLSVELELMREF
ncbi:GNAT family N-acetyltransferase [Enterococcus sp. LJL90]